MVRKCVETDGVRLVGIDTLNGYLNAIPTTDAPVTRMHELLSYLSERSVATLIILAQHGIVGSVMPVPVDLSYLADAIVLLRFFEAEGEVRKAISVVKKRTGVHENSIRELKLGPDRVQVGEPLKHFQGILTGVPQYVGPSKPLLSDDQPRLLESTQQRGEVYTGRWLRPRGHDERSRHDHGGRGRLWCWHLS
jgi:circadian clock protein KaiC